MVLWFRTCVTSTDSARLLKIKQTGRKARKGKEKKQRQSGKDRKSPGVLASLFFRGVGFSVGTKPRCWRKRSQPAAFRSRGMHTPSRMACTRLTGITLWGQGVVKVAHKEGGDKEGGRQEAGGMKRLEGGMGQGLL